MTRPVQDRVPSRAATQLKSPPKLVGASSLLGGSDAARRNPGGQRHGTCSESVQSTVATFPQNRIRSVGSKTRSRAESQRIYLLDAICSDAVLSVVAFGFTPRHLQWSQLQPRQTRSSGHQSFAE